MTTHEECLGLIAKPKSIDWVALSKGKKHEVEEKEGKSVSHLSSNWFANCLGRTRTFFLKWWLMCSYVFVEISEFRLNLYNLSYWLELIHWRVCFRRKCFIIISLIDPAVHMEIWPFVIDFILTYNRPIDDLDRLFNHPLTLN